MTLACPTHIYWCAFKYFVSISKNVKIGWSGLTFFCFLDVKQHWSKFVSAIGILYMHYRMLSNIVVGPFKDQVMKRIQEDYSKNQVMKRAQENYSKNQMMKKRRGLQHEPSGRRNIFSKGMLSLYGYIHAGLFVCFCLCVCVSSCVFVCVNECVNPDLKNESWAIWHHYLEDHFEWSSLCTKHMQAS